MTEEKPRVLVLASDDGLEVESRLRELIESSRTSPTSLDAEIVGLISIRPVGGLLRTAIKSEIPSECRKGNFDEARYKHYMELYQADFILLLGWFRPVLGIDPAKVITLNFDPLSAYGEYGGGRGYIYEKVHNAFVKGEISQSIISVNFLGENGNPGPVIYQAPVSIRNTDVSDIIARRASEQMNFILPMVLNRVVHGYIFLHDGRVQWADNNPKNEWCM